MITTYSYDAAGNRTVKNEGGTRTTYAYDAGNRLRRSQEVAGITTFTFDNNGNQRRMLSPTGDITTYTWTFENQLSRIEDPDNALTTYTWAPVNRNGVELRIARETEDVLTNYLWDDQRLLQETDEVGAVEAEYTLQPKLMGALVSQHRESESSFYSFDAIGSTAALTDDSQAITDEYAYKPFGELRSPPGTTENPFLWRGRHELYSDTDSGLYSLGRWQYEANQGRMITPLSDNGSGNQYAQNEPIDPRYGWVQDILPYIQPPEPQRPMTPEEFKAWMDTLPRRQEGPRHIWTPDRGVIEVNPDVDPGILQGIMEGGAITPEQAERFAEEHPQFVPQEPAEKPPWECTDEWVREASFSDKVGYMLKRAVEGPYLRERCPDHFRALVVNPWILTAIGGWIVCHVSPAGFVCAAIDVVVMGLWALVALSEARAWVWGLSYIAERLKLAQDCCAIEDAARVMADLLCHIPLDALLLCSGPSTVGRGQAGFRHIRNMSMGRALRSFADSCRCLRNQPGAVSRLRTKLGSFNGRAGYTTEMHPVLKSFVEANPGRYNGKCAEIDSISQALRAYEAATGEVITTIEQAQSVLEGSTVMTMQVGNSAARHGLPIDPCKGTCQPLLDLLGIEYVPVPN